MKNNKILKRKENIRHFFLKHKSLFGYGSGFLAVFVYALLNILSQTASAYHESFSLLSGENFKVIFAVLFVTVKELVAAIIYFIFSLNQIKRIKDIFQAFKMNWKKSTLAGVAGIFGGAIGFSLTTAGGLFLTSGIASPFYSLEIIIVLLVSKFLFKRKTNLFQNIGLILIILPILLLPVLDIVFSSSDNIQKDSVQNIITGTLLVFFGVICWSIESLTFDKITEYKKISVRTYVSIKQIFSLVACLVFVAPIFSVATTKNPSAVFTEFGILFQKNNWQALVVSISSGAILFLGRLLFFESVKFAGGTMANSIYNILPLVQIPLALLADLRALKGNLKVTYFNSVNNNYFWVLILVLAIGIGISIYGQIKAEGRKI